MPTMDLVTAFLTIGVLVVAFVAIPVAIVLLAINLLRSQREGTARSRIGAPRSDAEAGAEVVRGRFARGEIDEADLDAALRALGVAAAPPVRAYAGPADAQFDEPADAPEAGSHLTLHLLPADRWTAWAADPSARYAPDGFAAEGFIHCTDGAAEMIEVANRYYADQPGSFVVITLDLAAVGVPWRYDDPERRYPHVYGLLRWGAVRAVAAAERDPAGRFVGLEPARAIG
jgi:uncharacterized protein (DUF952 family)/uncharacterized membrane protein